MGTDANNSMCGLAKIPDLHSAIVTVRFTKGSDAPSVTTARTKPITPLLEWVYPAKLMVVEDEEPETTRVAAVA